jgi:hypothetical protein
MRRRYLPREPMPLAQLQALARQEPARYRQLVKTLARQRCETLQSAGVDVSDDELAQAIFEVIDRSASSLPAGR